MSDTPLTDDCPNTDELFKLCQRFEKQIAAENKVSEKLHGELKQTEANRAAAYADAFDSKQLAEHWREQCEGAIQSHILTRRELQAANANLEQCRIACLDTEDRLTRANVALAAKNTTILDMKAQNQKHAATIAQLRAQIAESEGMPLQLLRSVAHHLNIPVAEEIQTDQK